MKTAFKIAVALVLSGVMARPALAHPATAAPRASLLRAGSPQTDTSAEVASEQAEHDRWSLGASLLAGPFEEFPGHGIAVDALVSVTPRLRLGPRGTFYAPRTYANVQRSALGVDGVAHVTLIDTRLLDWYGAVGLGVGVFHDDYLRVYEDVTRYVPGLSVATGAELAASARLRFFAGLGGRAYSTDAITDSQWLELSAGTRLVF